MDDFILGPPPVNVPSMDTSSGDPLYTTPFSFNHVYASSANPIHLPMSLSSDSDIAGRTRVQAELLRHAGAPMLANPQGSPALVPELYTDHNHNQPSNHWLGWGESTGVPQTNQPQFASLDEAFSQNQYGADGLDTLSSEMFTGNFVGLAYRPRRSSVDYSDGSSASHSIPSSATSSNAHLPLSAGDMYQGASEDFQQRMLLEPQRRRDSMTSPSSAAAASAPAPESQSDQQSQSRVGEGGFSSAFGLMSIDDPNVLAGLSTDCVPFFSNAAMNMRPHSPNATPMPPKALSQQQLRDRGMSLSALPTPGLGRDVDNLWRQYMRTPMSGPHNEVPQSPSSRRRVRVSSLPSSKTPTAERALPGMSNGNANGNGEGARMTLHGNPEDLRSYEAAVNARNASLNLNLPKRRGTRASPPASIPSGARARRTLADPTHSHPHSYSQTANFDLTVSRPSSSSSTSSLSQAFASVSPCMKGLGAAPPMNGVSISLPVPRVSSMGSSSTQSGSRNGSRESSVASDYTGSSEGEMFRPAFKRLPSQTLGPANAKRAQFEKNGVGEKEKGFGIGNGVSSTNGGSRHIAALPGRACTTGDKHASTRNGVNVPRA
jgi:hypothetical protein